MSKLNPILQGIRQQRTEEFRRPDHNDFMTTSELAKCRFSGVRDNVLASQYEIWVAGKAEVTVTYLAVAADPLALTKAYSELFGITKASPSS